MDRQTYIDHVPVRFRVKQGQLPRIGFNSDSKLTVLGEFLNSAHEKAEFLQLDPLDTLESGINRAAVVARIQQSLKDYANDPKKNVLEPPFVVAVRYAIEQLIKKPL